MHDHDHSHGAGGHNHAHTPRDFGFAFATGTALNLAFVVAEAAFGVISNSTALLADAGHNLSDVIGLLLAWGAVVLARRKPTQRYTYGLRGSSILAALGNALLLMIAIGAIGWEAIGRFSDPKPVASGIVMIVAAIGIAVNGVTAWMFASGRSSDLNIRGAYLHMMADAAVSLGVVVAGGAIMLTGWVWLDPLTSLIIVAIIFVTTWGLLKDSVNMALAAVPRNVDLQAVRDYLSGLQGVGDVHHLHIWATSTSETALTAHLVMPDGYPGDAFLKKAAHGLRERFGIAHPTFQIELVACADQDDTV